ncbi:MAG: hypothetical protein Q9197_000091 [Variospora fuerteventurae]
MGCKTPSAMAAESRVLIVMTGGTICMRKSPDGLVPARGFLDAGMAPRPSFNDGSDPRDIEVVVGHGLLKPHRSLRTPISTYEKYVRYAVFEFDRLLDSSSIDAEGWTQIAKTVRENYTLFDGFVVLHGTDSLAYTCSALSFMLQNLGKPVVLTGSQAPISELQNDATDNLLGSLIIAGHFMIPEVCLFFQLQAFSREPRNQSFSDRLRGVFVAEYFAAGHSSFGLKGLILETFGSGNAPGGPDGALTKVLEAAISRGIVIVNVTQCMTGTVSPLYEPAMRLERAGLVPGHDMTTEAALAKLSYLLGQDLSTEGVSQQMAVSLRGELTEHTAIAFQHPRSLPAHLADLTAQGYAIASGNIPAVEDTLRGNLEHLLNEADYSGNTPLHIAATGPELRILELLLVNGASVHLRNKAGRTPLFLAANAGLKEHVRLLRASGAHLHAGEVEAAKMYAERSPESWEAAGV